MGKALGLWLNQAVRSRITYHLRKSRKKARSRLLWLLALIGLGVLFLAGGWALEKLRRRMIALAADRQATEVAQ